MRRLLETHCERAGDPHIIVEPVAINGHELPASYLELLRVANGFLLNRKAFRFFGIDTREAALDLRSWNRSSWVAEYGDLAVGLVFIAEDIFGDQYGFRYSADRRDPVFIKFWCEGGETEVIESETVQAWLIKSVLREKPTGWDSALACAALARGLTPSETEHLAFAVPLIVGGELEEANLEVMEREFHLNLLGQLSSKNRRLPDGARIHRFWPES